MITKFFNGKVFAKDILFDICKKSNIYCINYYMKPCLSIFLIGNVFSTNLYVKNKIIGCNKVNINFFIFKFSKTVKLNTLIMIIKMLNVDIKINAILIQKPLPLKLDNIHLFDSINYAKDVDLLSSKSFGKYILGYYKGISSCTSQAILYCLNEINVKLKGLKIVIFGYSNIVGKPLCYDLLYCGASVSIINKNDKNFSILSQLADILIIAIGVPHFLSSNLISFGSIIIDVGINCNKKNNIIGDVDINSIFGTASWITPVPGGIGPITVSMLLLNTLRLYFYQRDYLI